MIDYVWSAAVGAFTCSECGALVLEQDQDMHSAWHEALAQVLNSLDNGKVSEWEVHRAIRESWPW